MLDTPLMDETVSDTPHTKLGLFTYQLRDFAIEGGEDRVDVSDQLQRRHLLPERESVLDTPPKDATRCWTHRRWK